MGCCYGTETEAIEPDDPSKPLILPQNQDSRPASCIERNPNGPPSCPTDEQALLSSILAKTALNIIDVSASDFQGIEQREYMDKTRQYSHRLAVMGDGLPQRKRATLPSLTGQPHKVLASDLVSHLDLQQVSKIAAYAHSAISQIKVDAKEDLVVQFAIPEGALLSFSFSPSLKRFFQQPPSFKTVNIPHISSAHVFQGRSQLKCEIEQTMPTLKL